MLDFNLNWEAIGAIGEILGALSVVATLFYLSFQLKQNTEQVKSSVMATEVSAYQDMIGRIAEINTLRIVDAELAELISRGDNEPHLLSETDKLRYIPWIMTLIRHGDMAYFLYERNVIDRDRAISSMGPLLVILDKPGFKLQWELIKNTNTFSSGFVHFLDEAAKENNLT